MDGLPATGAGQSQTGAFPSIYPNNDREEIRPIRSRIALVFNYDELGWR